MSDNLFLPKSLVESIKRVAQSNVNVLVTGESGVGKDFVASLIHSYSMYSEQTPVTLDISTLPQELIERELFGSVKGAYTGAEDVYEGKLLDADNNTLILGEIGNIPLSVQGKINSFLDRGVIQPLGSNEVKSVNCRIIAVTNSDLSDLVESGKFRSDLYYRLNVVTFNVPPLRDRISEIIPLANYILSTISKGLSLSDDAKKTLLHYNWPGNIRELSNVLERAAVLSSKREITSEYLLLSSNNNGNISSTTLKEAIINFKREYILKVLEVNEWNVTKSAKVLGIQRTYLSRLIKELNI